MTPILECLLPALFLFIIYPYVLYPFIIYCLYKFQGKGRAQELNTDPAFRISCIIAVYNEEAVIQKKIESVLNSDYPKHLLKIYIGSDGSTDRSNEILKNIAETNEQVVIQLYSDRSGKTNVINRLTKFVLNENKSESTHILVYTDANIFLNESTLRHIVVPFQNPKVALVDSRIIQRTEQLYGIGESEKVYMNLEIWLKKMEGDLWGLSMGAFGGCYALRSTYSSELPAGLLVDDFYISMRAMLDKGLSITNHQAVCYEHIPDNLKEEFNRKRRIASGNFQNLQIFLPRILQMGFRLAFVFISHKVMRWLFPINVLLFFLICGILALQGYSIYSFAFILMTFVIGFLPFIDYILAKFHIKIQLLRAWRYFIFMNIAVLVGFYRYLRGIQQSTWQPPKRTM
ncbi:MAG: glycosyltransferase [Saprospiraceae bacterium]|nr:glycosyltransferase [Saprospiraceae bacterium]